MPLSYKRERERLRGNNNKYILNEHSGGYLNTCVVVCILSFFFTYNDEDDDDTLSNIKR
jgi:hypothetical protein